MLTPEREAEFRRWIQGERELMVSASGKGNPDTGYNLRRWREASSGKEKV